METTTATPIASDPKVASPVSSVKEITPCPKNARVGEKGKCKIDYGVWGDATTAMGRAHNVITAKELNSLSAVPSHELGSRHIHKLVQVHSCLNFVLRVFFF